MDRDNKNGMIQGHNSEKDSRSTLKIYHRAIRMLREINQIPERTDIENFITKDLNYMDWEKEVKNQIKSKAQSQQERAFADVFNFPNEPIELD